MKNQEFNPSNVYARLWLYHFWTIALLTHSIKIDGNIKPSQFSLSLKILLRIPFCSFFAMALSLSNQLFVKVLYFWRLIAESTIGPQRFRNINRTRRDINLLMQGSKG